VSCGACSRSVQHRSLQRLDLCQSWYDHNQLLWHGSAKRRSLPSRVTQAPGIDPRLGHRRRGTHNLLPPEKLKQLERGFMYITAFQPWHLRCHDRFWASATEAYEFRRDSHLLDCCFLSLGDCRSWTGRRATTGSGLADLSFPKDRQRLAGTVVSTVQSVTLCYAYEWRRTTKSHNIRYSLSDLMRDRLAGRLSVLRA
jgi:hypothetical protein